MKEILTFKMTSSNSELTNGVLDELYDDIIDHMKRLGQFDEIRIKLIDPIWSDPNFIKIIEKFENECEQFCERADLNLNRNALRMRLASYFDFSSQTNSGHMVKAHIRKFLSMRDEQLRTDYSENARKFLIKKYTLRPESPPPEVPEENTSPVKVESIPVKDDSGPDKEDLTQIKEDMSPVKDDSILGNEDLIPEDDLGSQQVVDMEIEDSPDRPMYSPIECHDDESDELRRLSFSSVSTVHTADLSDFDNSIKLSDDEANIVGKPKNSMVSVDIIKNRINNLAPANFDCKQEPTELNDVSQEQVDATESDGTCPESNSGKRATRARKVNPRYSNEDFTHTPYKK